MHKKILNWHAANPTATWMFWGIVWIIVLILCSARAIPLRSREQAALSRAGYGR